MAVRLLFIGHQEKDTCVLVAYTMCCIGQRKAACAHVGFVERLDACLECSSVRFSVFSLVAMAGRTSCTLPSPIVQRTTCRPEARRHG